MSKLNKCRICDEVLGLYSHNRQVYCGETCASIAKDTKVRVAKQKLQFEILMGIRVVEQHTYKRLDAEVKKVKKPLDPRWTRRGEISIRTGSSCI